MYFLQLVFCDAARPWQIGFQEPATPIAEAIINLHNDLWFYLIVIAVFVSWLLARVLHHFTYDKNPIPSQFSHGTFIEIIWTTIPSIILLFIAIPTFCLIYSADEIIDPAITVKAVGHQWYWSYEYSDYNIEEGESINYDSYMIPESDLKRGQLRLLEVDNRVVLPVNTHVRILLTSTDVIHAWAVPSLAVKCDAIPGRLNQIGFFIKREGVFYGQCSEICGVNHGFMPIVVEAVSLEDYVSWVSAKLEG
jgi:cytochrome c oxidase subunit 2